MSGLKDLEGRPMLLGTFLALSQVDPALRQALAQMELPKDRELDFSSVDELLNSAADSVLNTLSTAISGEKIGNRNVGQALDRLTLVIGRIEKDHTTQLEKQAGSLLGKAEGVVKGWIQAGSEKMLLWADARDAALKQERAALDDQAVDYVASSVRFASQVLDASKGESVAKSLLQFNNTWSAPRFLKELGTEVIGTTDENAGVNMLLNKGRYVVSRVRQEFREELPPLLEEKFSRELTEDEWQALHLGIGRADTAALGYSTLLKNIRKLYADDAALGREIARTEAALAGRIGKGAPLQVWQERSAALARFMVHRQIDPDNNNLQRNAHAIARDLNPTGKSREHAAQARAVDRLVSLYAMFICMDALSCAQVSLSRSPCAYLDLRRRRPTSPRDRAALPCPGWMPRQPIHAPATTAIEAFARPHVRNGAVTGPRCDL